MEAIKDDLLQLVKTEIGTYPQDDYFLFLKECSTQISLKYSNRSNNTRFHFDCTDRSKRNLFSMLAVCMDSDNRPEIYKRILEDRKKVYPANYKKTVRKSDDSFLLRLSKLLSKIDLRLESPSDEFVCILVNNRQEASCVSTIMHLCNLDSSSIRGLKEYVGNNQIDRVKRFITKNKSHSINFHIYTGPNFVLCSIKPRHRKH